MEEMYVYKNQQKLRWGIYYRHLWDGSFYGSGSYAFGQKRVSHVKVSTPKGIDLDHGDRGGPFYKKNRRYVLCRKDQG